MLTVKSVAVVVMTAAMAQTAYGTGTSGGGGGVVFECRESEAGAGNEKVYLADTYDIVKNLSWASLKKMETTTVDEALSVIYAGVKVEAPTEAPEILENLRALYFEPGGALPLLGDDDIKSSESECREQAAPRGCSFVPSGCVKRQLAIQDFSRNTVYYDRALYFKLTAGERAFFRLHESFVRKYRANLSFVRARTAWQGASRRFFETIKGFRSVDYDDLEPMIQSEGFECGVQADWDKMKPILCTYPCKLDHNQQLSGKENVCILYTNRGPNDFRRAWIFDEAQFTQSVKARLGKSCPLVWNFYVAPKRWIHSVIYDVFGSEKYHFGDRSRPSSVPRLGAYSVYDGRGLDPLELFTERCSDQQTY